MRQILLLLAIVIAAAALFLYVGRTETTEGFADLHASPPSQGSPAVLATPTPELKTTTQAPVLTTNLKGEVVEPVTPHDAEIAEKKAASQEAQDIGAGSATHEYTVDGGVAVIDGDVVIGLPGSSKTAQIPLLTPWPTARIPYFIQPTLSNPERITEALKYFEPTSVRFIPVTAEKDVLVFEEAQGRCKSYMGKIGGKQPVYLSQGCGPHEIAHELMHALGFLHEQNRSDRDQTLIVNDANILESAKINFEKFPQALMTLSGLSPLDPDSIMIYPPGMFSRNGEPTMTTRNGSRINPSQGLSASDIARVNAYYGEK